MGVRMCAPSMPPPPEPSTRLSRVAPHEACFATSTSGMPYLANSPFSLAMISGEASVRAMKPSVTLSVSTRLPCANAPDGKSGTRSTQQDSGGGGAFQNVAASKLAMTQSPERKRAVNSWLIGSKAGTSGSPWPPGGRRSAAGHGGAHLVRGGAEQVGAIDAVRGGFDVDRGAAPGPSAPSASGTSRHGCATESWRGCDGRHGSPAGRACARSLRPAC